MLLNVNSGKITMTQDTCKMLMKEEVQKVLTAGRRMVMSVDSVLKTCTKTLRAEIQEKTEAENMLNIHGKEPDDVGEIMLTLAVLQKETGILLINLSTQLDEPISLLKRWLDDPSVMQIEIILLEKIDVLMKRHTQAMANISKLQKVKNKKRRIMDKTQRQIDTYPFGGQENRSISALQKKVIRLREDLEIIKGRYCEALDAERKDRKYFIGDVEELKSMFVKYEEKRLFTLVDAIGQYSKALADHGYNRPKIRSVLEDLTEMSTMYNPDKQIDAFLARGCVDLKFPAPQEYPISPEDLRIDLESVIPVETPEQLTKNSDASGDIMTGATCGAGDAHSSGTPDLAFGFCEGNASHRREESNGHTAYEEYMQYPEGGVSASPTKPLQGNKSSQSYGYNRYVKNVSVAGANSPTDASLVQSQSRQRNRDNICTLPVISKAPASDGSTANVSEKTTSIADRQFPKIEIPENSIPKRNNSSEKGIMSQLPTSESNLEGNVLPQVQRSIVAIKAVNHTPLKFRQKMDHGFPHIPNTVVENTKILAFKSPSRNDINQPVHKSISRMDVRTLPKMPNIGTGNSMVAAPVKARSNQDNANPRDMPRRDRSLQVPNPSEGAESHIRLQTRSGVDTLPLMSMPGTNAPPTYNTMVNGGTQPTMPNRNNAGYLILPSKPKVQMNVGNVQSLVSTKPATENTAINSLWSRHSVGVVVQSRRLDSGIPAGFRGSSSKRDMDPRANADANTNRQNTMQSQMASTGAGKWMKNGLPVLDKSSHRLVGSWSKEDKRPDPEKSSQRLAESWVKDKCPQDKPFQKSVGAWLKEDKNLEQDCYSNADRLLSKYDVKNLEDDSKEEDLLEKASRLLDMHDVRKIFSEESLGESDV